MILHSINLVLTYSCLPCLDIAILHHPPELQRTEYPSHWIAETAAANNGLLWDLCQPKIKPLYIMLKTNNEYNRPNEMY